MKYMLLVYLNEQVLSDEEREHCYAESAQLTQELHAKGQYLSASPLHPVATATSVRVRDGRRVVTDGPFAETREQLGGFYIVEANGLNEALDIAERIPPAKFGTIEVRPVREIAGLPGHSSRPLVRLTSKKNSWPMSIRIFVIRLTVEARNEIPITGPP